MGLSALADDARRAWRELLAGEREMVWHGPREMVDRIAACSPSVIPAALTPALSQGERETIFSVFPGSFNPLHAGHRRMGEIAAELLAQPVAFEISVRNVDKPPLTEAEIDHRLSQFAAHDAICLTRAATFVEKARLFPRATFIVGADTILRIADARYYADEATRNAAVQEIAGLACRFLVFGRTAAGSFLTLDELWLPADLAALCQGVAASAFRLDISSTEQRDDPEPHKAEE